MGNVTDMLVSCVITTLALFWFVFVPFLTPNHIWRQAAIDRGYALYCPIDGEFAWEGECEK